VSFQLINQSQTTCLTFTFYCFVFNFFRKRAWSNVSTSPINTIAPRLWKMRWKFLCNSRLPQFDNSLLCESSGRKFPAKVVKTKLNYLFDRSTNQPLFTLCLPFRNFSKHTKIVDHMMNHVICMAAFLDAGINLKKSAVFLVNFPDISLPFYSPRSLCFAA